jgi:hypothetical protein
MKLSFPELLIFENETLTLVVKLMITILTRLFIWSFKTVFLPALLKYLK